MSQLFARPLTAPWGPSMRPPWQGLKLQYALDFNEHARAERHPLFPTEQAGRIVRNINYGYQALQVTMSGLPVDESAILRGAVLLEQKPLATARMRVLWTEISLRELQGSGWGNRAILWGLAMSAGLSESDPAYFLGRMVWDAFEPGDLVGIAYPDGVSEDPHFEFDTGLFPADRVYLRILFIQEPQETVCVFAASLDGVGWRTLAAKPLDYFPRYLSLVVGAQEQVSMYPVAACRWLRLAGDFDTAEANAFASAGHVGFISGTVNYNG